MYACSVLNLFSAKTDAVKRISWKFILIFGRYIRKMSDEDHGEYTAKVTLVNNKKTHIEDQKASVTHLKFFSLKSRFRLFGLV